MILSHTNVSSLIKTGANISVESDASYFDVGFCNYAVRNMAGGWHAI